MIYSDDGPWFPAQHSHFIYSGLFILFIYIYFGAYFQHFNLYMHLAITATQLLKNLNLMLCCSLKIFFIVFIKLYFLSSNWKRLSQKKCFFGSLMLEISFYLLLRDGEWHFRMAPRVASQISRLSSATLDTTLAPPLVRNGRLLFHWLSKNYIITWSVTHHILLFHFLLFDVSRIIYCYSNLYVMCEAYCYCYSHSLLLVQLFYQFCNTITQRSFHAILRILGCMCSTYGSPGCLCLA